MTAALGDIEHRWYWYAPKTDEPVCLDSSAYKSVMWDGASRPYPEWACSETVSGLHADARIGSIDIIALNEPDSSVQMHWLRPYFLYIFDRNWMGRIEDLLDASGISAGRVSSGGGILETWVTLHGSVTAPLLSKGCETKICPVCGDRMSWPVRNVFLEGGSDLQHPIILNYSGLFVRSDIVTERKLATPRGGFKPVPVSFG